MQIKEAKIFNFGKLQNVNFRFAEGINVVYGENEQGKSTLHAFLMGMLFGMEKGRGRASAGDMYSRYEPWHAPSFYSGALRFEVDAKPFYLERNFYNKEKNEYLRNEADGEELSVAYGDLEVLFGGIGREEFGNTYNVSQSGAATGKGMADCLTTYLTEAEAGGNGKVHVLQAQKNLSARKKELSAEQKRLQEERERILDQKHIEWAILSENAEGLRSQIQVFEETQSELEEKLSLHNRKHSKSKKMIFVLSVLSVIIVLSILAYLGIVPLGVLATVGVVSVVSVVLVCLPRKNEAEELLKHAKDMLEQMKEGLQENENEIINLLETMEELKRPSDREKELQQNVAALELAGTQIEKISREYYLEMADELNGEISKWISLLTKGTYDSARLDKDGRLWIVAEQKEVPPEALSRGTLEQIYLALRLAVGSVLMKDEDMPIFLDEAFAMYDDIRLSETLKALAKTGRQILIFTCQKREMAILQQEAIAYHRIYMNSGQSDF